MSGESEPPLEKIPTSELVARMARAHERREKVQKLREGSPPVSTGKDVREKVQHAPPSRPQRAELPEARIPVNMRVVTNPLPHPTAPPPSPRPDLTWLWGILLAGGVVGMGMLLAYFGFNTFLGGSASSVPSLTSIPSNLTPVLDPTTIKTLASLPEGVLKTLLATSKLS
jgi:hypothetical protein